MRAPAWLLGLLVLGACKSDGGTTTPTVSYTGAWEGTTSQGHVLQFYVEDDGIHITAFRFTIDGAACSTSSTVYLTREPPDGPYAVTGADLAISTAGSSGVAQVNGSFSSATAASGTLHATSIPCNGAVDATWTAAKVTAAGTGFAGSWSGTLSSTQISPTTATINLTQNGATIGGAFGMANGATGTFAGTVSGNLGTFTITETTSGCAGSFAGHALRRDDGSGPRLFIGYSGNDCLGAHNRGGGVLTTGPLAATASGYTEAPATSPR